MEPRRAIADRPWLLETVREINHRLARAQLLGPRFQLASDAEQRYLAAMAGLGDPPYRTREVATRYGAKAARGVSVIPPEYAAVARRYLGDEAARAYLAQIDQPGTRMAPGLGCGRGGGLGQPRERRA